MEKSEINVSELCRKLGITRQTLYRYVSQNDELRKEEKKITQNFHCIDTVTGENRNTHYQVACLGKLFVSVSVRTEERV